MKENVINIHEQYFQFIKIYKNEPNKHKKFLKYDGNMVQIEIYACIYQTFIIFWTCITICL